MSISSKTIFTNQKSKILLIVIIFLILVEAFRYFLPVAVDWHRVYKPAVDTVLAGQSPYRSDLFVNAPWVLVPLLPLGFLPESLSRGILTVACLVSIVIVARKFGAKPIGIIFLLLSPPVLQLVMDGNIDWMVLYGFILPPQIGLFFIAIKPQVGLGVVIFWLIQSYRKNGIREIIRVFTPVTIGFILSFVLYGFWPLNLKAVMAWNGNTSLWPVSIPAGLVLLYRAIKKQKINQAIAASPCLTPYLLLQSYIGLFVSFCNQTVELIIAVIGLWIVVIIRGLSFW